MDLFSKHYNPCFKSTTDEYTKEQVKLGVGSLGCANVTECIPVFDKAPCEKVYKGGHNSFIVLGRDRNSDWLSGRGGEGMTQSGMIDIVVGRGQLLAEQNKKNKKSPYDGLDSLGPSFATDAARIYITQAAKNIDQYFAIESGGKSSAGKSAIGLKADHVRIIGRETVGIHAGRGKWEGLGADGETNCLGQRLETGRIELITSKPDELEPMVLGTQLINYLKEENELVRNMLKQLFQLHINIALISGGLTAVPGMAAITLPIIKESGAGAVDQVSETFNSYLRELGALDNDLIPGDGYLLSRSCFVSK